MTSVLILFSAKPLAAVNPAGPAPIIITSESVYSCIVSLNIVAIALVISFSLTSAKIFSIDKYIFHSINTYIRMLWFYANNYPRCKVKWHEPTIEKKLDSLYERDKI